MFTEHDGVFGLWRDDMDCIKRFAEKVTERSGRFGHAKSPGKLARSFLIGVEYVGKLDIGCAA